jgi:cell division protein FtsB
MSKIKMQNSSFYLLKNKIDFKIYYKLILLIKKIIVSNMSHFSEEIQSILKRLNKLERENRELKNENKQMKEKISKLENDNNDISNQVRLMKRNYSNKFNLLTKNIMRNEKIISNNKNKINNTEQIFKHCLIENIDTDFNNQKSIKIRYTNDNDIRVLLYSNKSINSRLFTSIFANKNISIKLKKQCFYNVPEHDKKHFIKYEFLNTKKNSILEPELIKFIEEYNF